MNEDSSKGILEELKPAAGEVWLEPILALLCFAFAYGVVHFWQDANGTLSAKFVLPLILVLLGAGALGRFTVKVRLRARITRLEERTRTMVGPSG